MGWESAWTTGMPRCWSRWTITVSLRVRWADGKSMQFQKPCLSEAYLLKCWEHKDDSFGLAVWSAITGTEPLQLAQSLDPVLTSGDALLGQVVGDQPVAQAGTLCMHVDRGVDQVRIVPVTLEDRIREPLVVGLSGETHPPA